MNENERVIIEATLEELKAAEDNLTHCVDDNFDERSREILLAAIQDLIGAREMYGEED